MEDMKIYDIFMNIIPVTFIIIAAILMYLAVEVKNSKLLKYLYKILFKDFLKSFKELRFIELSAYNIN